MKQKTLVTILGVALIAVIALAAFFYFSEPTPTVYGQTEWTGTTDLVYIAPSYTQGDQCDSAGDRICLGEFVGGQDFLLCADLDGDGDTEWNEGSCAADKKCTYSPALVCVDESAW